MKEEATTHPHLWVPFSKQNWEMWKQEFEMVAASEVYDDDTKAVSRQPLGQMRETEKCIDQESVNRSH